MYTLNAKEINPTGFLKVSQNMIVDWTRNTVVLNGVNFDGYEYGLWSGLYQHNEADYQIEQSVLRPKAFSAVRNTQRD